MVRENGYSPERNYKVQSHHLKEVDISRFPSSILQGLIPARTEDAALEADEVSPENANEVWILQCPSNVQLGPLIQGKKLYLDERRQIFDQDYKSYEAVCLRNSQSERTGDAALLPDDSGKMQLVSFPVTGHIMIKEVVEEALAVIPLPSPAKVHQLPTGLKIRHPIYGTDYESTLEQPTSTKRKKKRKAVDEDVEMVYYEVTPHGNVPPSRESRERKRKKGRDEVTPVELSVVVEEEVPRKKKKRRTEVDLTYDVSEPKVEPKEELDSDIEVIPKKHKRKTLLETPKL